MKTLVKMMAAVVLPALAAGAAELEGWWRFTEADGDEATVVLVVFNGRLEGDCP